MGFKEKVSIGPGETKELIVEIPTELVEERKRQGKTRVIIGMKYKDESGKEYEQDFEFNIDTGEIREIIDTGEIREIIDTSEKDVRDKDKKRPILELEYIGKNRGE